MLARLRGCLRGASGLQLRAAMSSDAAVDRLRDGGRLPPSWGKKLLDASRSQRWNRQQQRKQARQRDGEAAADSGSTSPLLDDALRGRRGQRRVLRQLKATLRREGSTLTPAAAVEAAEAAAEVTSASLPPQARAALRSAAAAVAVKHFASRSQLRSAEEVMTLMATPDEPQSIAAAAAALIEAYGAAGESDGGGVPAGMKLLLSLADTDVRLTRRHFHALLASLAGSPASAWRPQAMDWAWSLLAVMRQQSCAPNVATYSLLLSVAAPAADGRAKRFHISNVLKQLSADGLRPSGDTAAALFAACDSGELWDAVVSFLREGGAAAGGHSVQRSWLDDAAVAAGRCERVEAALDLARRHSMSARGYNALLLQLAAAGRSAAGWALLRDMQKRYLRPSSRACCAVLQAFADDGATAEQLAGVFAALPWHAAAARKYVNLVAAAGHHNYDRPSHDYDSVGLQPALPPSLLLSVADGSPSSAGSTSAGLQKLWAQLYFLSLRCGDFGATQSLMGRAEARRLWPNAATAAAVLAGCSRASQLPLAFSIISWAIVRGSLSAADVQRPLRRALLRLAEPTADSRFVLLSEQLSELMAVADDGTGRLPARALVDEIVFLAVSGGSGGADGGITDEAAVHVHWARLAEYAAITLTEWPPPEASALPTGWAAERERQEREGRS